MAAAAVLPAGKVLSTMDVDAQPSTSAEQEDLYTRLKTLQRQLEFLEIQVRFLGDPWGREKHGMGRMQGSSSSGYSPIAPFSLFAGGVHQGGAEEP
jgi:hypothetical protein